MFIKKTEKLNLLKINMKDFFWTNLNISEQKAENLGRLLNKTLDYSGLQLTQALLFFKSDRLFLIIVIK